NPRERASYLPENFEPLAEAGVLELWDGPREPWPGVEIVTADGHTRGQQLVRVHGPEGAVYFVADLVPTSSHVRISYVMVYAGGAECGSGSSISGATPACSC